MDSTNIRVIKDVQEYKELIHSVEDNFGCIEEWQDYFGFELAGDEDTGEVLESILDYQGEIRIMPESFPCVIYGTFDTASDFRNGDMKIRIFDYATFDELEIKLKEN